MAHAVAHVASALTDAFGPGIEVQFAVQFYVGAADAHPLAVNAGKVGLAAGAGAVAAIEGVVPHVELGYGIGIDRGNEVDGGNLTSVGTFHGVGNVDNVFVGPNAVIRWDGECGDGGF